MFLVAKSWWHFARQPGQGLWWLLRRLWLLPWLLPWRLLWLLAVGRGSAGMTARAGCRGSAARRAGRLRLAYTALRLF